MCTTDAATYAGPTLSPEAAVRKPIAAGPASLVTLTAMELSDKALTRRRPSSSCGISDVRTGWFMAILHPKQEGGEVHVPEGDPTAQNQHRHDNIDGEAPELDDDEYLPFVESVRDRAAN